MKCEFKTEARRKLIPSEYLKQPQPPGCPILRALCEGWDANRHATKKLLLSLLSVLFFLSRNRPGAPPSRTLRRVGCKSATQPKSYCFCCCLFSSFSAATARVPDPSRTLRRVGC